MKPEEIEIRSEAVQDILSRPPNSIVRLGSSTVLIVILIMLAVSIVIEYPDTIIAPVTLTTQQPPASVKALSSGRISHLLVQEGQLVDKESLLAVIDNAANFEDWKAIREPSGKFHSILMEQDSVGQLNLQTDLNLGEMQSAYTQFFRAYQDYWRFIETNFYGEKMAQSRQKIIAQRQLSDGLSEQQAILQTDFALTEKQLAVDESLFKKEVLTERDLDMSKQAYLQEKLRLANSKTERINSNVRIQELEGQLLELKQQFREERNQFVEQLKQASLNLDASFSSWEKRFLLVAPIQGKVSFFKFWADNQFVDAGAEVMVILPEENNVFGYASLSQAGFGKVAIGQEVHIRLNGFPFEEFGILKGEVESISGIARDNNYLVRVKLPNGFKTHYGKELNFSQEMQGEAHIITEKMRLIERVFYQMRKILMNA